MPEHVPSPTDRNPNVRREPSDASVRGLLAVLTVLLIFGVLVVSGVWQLFAWYEGRLDSDRAAASPLSPGPSPPPPPEPRLEEVDRRDGRALDAAASLAAGETELQRYARTLESGFVRVPIGRAMDRLADKLPVRPEPPAEDARRAGGLVDGGGPNSGRLFQKGGR
jgi:hypothetical protein